MFKYITEERNTEEEKGYELELEWKNKKLIKWKKMEKKT